VCPMPASRALAQIVSLKTWLDETACRGACAPGGVRLPRCRPTLDPMLQREEGRRGRSGGFLARGVHADDPHFLFGLSSRCESVIGVQDTSGVRFPRAAASALFLLAPPSPAALSRRVGCPFKPAEGECGDLHRNQVGKLDLRSRVHFNSFRRSLKLRVAEPRSSKSL